MRIRKVTRLKEIKTIQLKNNLMTDACNAQQMIVTLYEHSKVKKEDKETPPQQLMTDLKYYNFYKMILCNLKYSNVFEHFLSFLM